MLYVALMMETLFTLGYQANVKIEMIMTLENKLSITRINQIDRFTHGVAVFDAIHRKKAW